MAWEKLGTASVGGAAIANNSWKELDRVTLTGTSTTMDTNTFTAKDNLMLLYFGLPAGSYVQAKLQVGNSTIDTGSNYARRHSRDGGSDSTATSGTDMGTFGDGTSSANEFGVSDFVNISAQEKLQITQGMNSNSSGAGNAPHRAEVVGKWANTSNQINRIQLTDMSGSGFASGSEIVVLGYDNDEADSGTNFWQELADVELSSSGSSLNTGTISAKKYLMLECYVTGKSTSNKPVVQFNSDTASNYGRRYSIDGGSDTTEQGGSIQMVQTSNTTPTYCNAYIINKSDKEKLYLGNALNQNTAGASTAPGRTEAIGKWANTSNQITSINVFASAGTFGSGSYLKVYGAD